MCRIEKETNDIHDDSLLLKDGSLIDMAEKYKKGELHFLKDFLGEICHCSTESLYTFAQLICTVPHLFAFFSSSKNLKIIEKETKQLDA